MNTLKAIIGITFFGFLFSQNVNAQQRINSVPENQFRIEKPLKEANDSRPNGIYPFIRVYLYTLSAMAGVNYERQVYAWPKGKILARVGGGYSGGFELRGPVFLGDVLAAFGQHRSKVGVGFGYLGFIHNSDGLFEMPLFYSFTFDKGFSFSVEIDPALYRDTDPLDPTRYEFQPGLQLQVGYCF